MRAAIEAHDAGADVGADLEDPSRPQPLRGRRGGINAALGNRVRGRSREARLRHRKGSDYIGDQDAIQILCDERPTTSTNSRNWGAVFSRTEDGPDRAASLRRGRRAAHRIRADITVPRARPRLYEQV